MKHTSRAAFAFWLLFSNYACADTEQAPLRFAGILKEYQPNSAIKFRILNEGANSVSFNCACEIEVGGEFHEAISSIFQTVEKSDVRPILLSNPELVIEWDIPNRLPSLRPRLGKTYRLRIDIIKPKKSQVYSQPFLINPSANK